MKIEAYHVHPTQPEANFVNPKLLADLCKASSYVGTSNFGVFVDVHRTSHVIRFMPLIVVAKNALVGMSLLSGHTS